MSAPAHDAIAESWQTLRERGQTEQAERIFTLWSPDAGPFVVFVLRPDAATAARLGAVGDALRAAGVGQVIPPGFLHITVQSLGNIGAAGLTEGIVARLADAVEATLRPVAPFGVRLRGIGSFGPAVFAGVEETDAAGSLARMQHAVVDALLAVHLVPVRHPERAYLPHLSLCYYDCSYPAAEIAILLAPHRARDFGVLRVDAIELVRVGGDGTPYPPMETVRRIPLLGAQ